MIDQAVALKAVALAAALVLIALVLQQLTTLLLALTLTLIISLPLSAAGDLAERRRLPRVLGVIGGLLIVFAPLGGLLYLIIPSFASQAKQFANQLPHTIASAERYIHSVTGVQTNTLSAELTRFIQGYTQHPQRLLGPVEEVGLSVAGILAGLLVVLIVAVFIAVNPAPLRDGLMRTIPAERRDVVLRILGRVRHAWLGWLQAMAIDMLVLGGLLYLGMRLVGLSFAAGFAIFSALCTVIPNYGSIISAIPPVLLGLAHSPGKAALVLAVYVVVNQIEGNLILPVVMARTVELPAAVVALGVLVMAQLFGLIGVIISIPLLSLAIILVEELWVHPHEEAAALVVRAPP